MMHRADGVFRNGAPRSMKMSTIALPWRYDAAARWALQSPIVRRPAILGCASWSVLFPFHGGLTTPDQLLALSDE